MKTRIFTLMIALFAMTSVSLADEMTSLKLTVRIDGGEPETLTFPASGMSILDHSEESISSLILQKAEVTTTGYVSDVTFYGALYNSSDIPSLDNWIDLPLTSNGSGSWVLDMGEGVDLIESGHEGEKKTFQFYLKGKNGSNSDIYYNNGGQNYKIMFAIGGGASDWTVRFYKDETATLSLIVNNSNKNYTYNGDGIRTQFYGENPGEVSTFTINGFSTWFIYNKDAGVEIEKVRLRYRINVDGTEGQWNSLAATQTGSFDSWNSDEQKYDYMLQYGYEGQNEDILSGLSTGHDYVLELAYEITTTGGDTKRLTSSDMKLAFTVTDNKLPEYKGMTLTFTANGNEVNLSQNADYSPDTYPEFFGGRIYNLTSLVLNNFSVTLGGDNIDAVRFFWRVYSDEQTVTYDSPWNEFDATVTNGEVWSRDYNVDILESCKNEQYPNGLESNKAYHLYCYIAPHASGEWVQNNMSKFGYFTINFKTGDLSTGIDGITQSEPKAISAYYDLSGKQLTAPQKGVNIIKMSDGTTKKVVK